MIYRLHTAAFTFLALVSAAIGDWSGWHTNAYSTNADTIGIFRFQTNLPSADLYSSAHIHIYTNWLAPTNPAVVTNSFRHNVRVYVSPHGATDTVSRSYNINAYTQDNVGASYSVPQVVTVTTTADVGQAAMYVEARDVWAIDGVRAAIERAVAAGIDPWNQYTYAAEPGDIYARNREYLVWIKGLMAYAFNQGWLDTSSQSNRIWEGGVTNAGGDYRPVGQTNVSCSLTLTGLLHRAGAPANYFQYTPHSMLSGDGTNFDRAVMTSTAVQVCSGTNACTNISVGHFGSWYTNIATNGAIWSMVDTNANIIEGRTSQDYGWMYLRRIATSLQQRASYYITATTDVARVDYFSCGDPTNDYADTGAMCDDLWCEASTNALERAVNIAWRYEADRLRLEDGGITGDEPFNCISSNLPDMMNVWSTVPRALWHAQYFSTNVFAVLSNITPIAHAYQNRYGKGETYTDSVGWPFAVTNTVDIYEYDAAASGLMTLGGVYSSGLVVGAEFLGPQVSTLDVAPASCDTPVALGFDEIDSSVSVVLCEDPVGSTNKWTDVIEFIGGRIERRTVFEFSVAPFTAVDWVNGTNGFRYR